MKVKAYVRGLKDVSMSAPWGGTQEIHRTKHNGARPKKGPRQLGASRYTAQAKSREGGLEAALTVAGSGRGTSGSCSNRRNPTFLADRGECRKTIKCQWSNHATKVTRLHFMPNAGDDQTLDREG